MPAQPPSGSSGGTNVAIGLGVVVVVALVIAIVVVLSGGDDDEDPPETQTGGTDETTTTGEDTTTSEGATTTEGDGQGSTISVFDLSEGDCWNAPESGASVEEVEVVHCSLQHDYEVFSVYNVQGTEYPGDQQIRDRAADECRGDKFTDFIGVAYTSSAYYTNELTPTSGSWGNGDREVVCSAYQRTSADDATPVPREGSLDGINE